MNARFTFSSIIQSVNKRLLSTEFYNRYRIGNAFSRSRKLSFQNMIYFVLSAAHKSLSISYAHLREFLPDEKLPMVSKQALSKARQGISAEAFQDLFLHSVKEFYHRYKNFTLWNGFHIYAVDGSTIQIPESKENLDVFGYNPNKYSRDTPLASVSVLYDVMNDILVDVHLEPYQLNERSSAKKHMEHLPGFSNSIILFDRGYPSEALFRFLDQKGVYFLMRAPKTFKKAISEHPDTIFTYPAKSDYKALTLRSIWFALENDNKEYLITNLLSADMDAHMFKQLYFLRWGIESKYRELKNRLEIENFNSVKPISIKQEFFAAMLLSNLASIIKKEADLLITEKSTGNHLHKYQSNRSFILNRIKNLIICLLKVKANKLKEMILQLIEDSAKVQSIVRPNRKYGRFRRNTRRRYYTHMKSCI